MKRYRIAYVPGGFDMFHIGHLEILRRAASIADRVIAGVVDDETLWLAKGKWPVIPFHDRAEIVGSVGIVNGVIADHSTSKVDAWRQVAFDVLVKGDDWKHTTKGKDLELEMMSVGVDVVYFPYTPGTSSTILRTHSHIRMPMTG